MTCDIRNFYIVAALPLNFCVNNIGKVIKIAATVYSLSSIYYVESLLLLLCTYVPDVTEYLLLCAGVVSR